jgi:polyisoprenoid-binding protein YceI
MTSRATAAILALLLAAHPASAAHWNVDYAKSRLGFTVQWSNEPFSAQFKRWNADIDFNPGDLAHARASVSVDLASESSDEPDFDSGLKGAQGFQTSQFSTAHFVTTSFVHKSADAYEARGTLNIRGITRDITLPFTLAIDGRTAHMTGTAHVLRTDFGVGQGEWAAPDPVAHDVAITIDLFATQ